MTGERREYVIAVFIVLGFVATAVTFQERIPEWLSLVIAWFAAMVALYVLFFGVGGNFPE